jgi:hypothetical protein
VLEAGSYNITATAVDYAGNLADPCWFEVIVTKTEASSTTGTGSNDASTSSAMTGTVGAALGYD